MTFSFLHGQASVGQPTRSYNSSVQIQDVVLKTYQKWWMREEWRERIGEICASSTTWWWCISYHLRNFHALLQQTKKHCTNAHKNHSFQVSERSYLPAYFLLIPQKVSSQYLYQYTKVCRSRRIHILLDRTSPISTSLLPFEIFFITYI